ncbi:cupin domain-containing protein [Roseicella aquatilis]|uniref:Cupin domain-containing protein n=1 Tax=Roseicella aquatilis TaxID=2527868 RepID=A0A4R4D575_9PROT|nr:cupin domain-containing protein [Roseicella aquatilis]TCZ54285.1 cupin domain-containing protein [Roseicella aquatilis]
MTTPRFGRIGDGPSAPAGGEAFAELAASGGGRVVRSASRGQQDPAGQWYDQAEAEFVLLLAGAARLGFADGTERSLAPGDWAVIPAHCRHRVAWTDPAAETLWLAVHLPAT